MPESGVPVALTTGEEGASSGFAVAVGFTVAEGVAVGVGSAKGVAGSSGAVVGISVGDGVAVGVAVADVVGDGARVGDTVLGTACPHAPSSRTVVSRAIILNGFIKLRYPSYTSQGLS